MPKLIDRYEIIKKISEGNISIAYEAHDPGTGRDVVIKLLKQIDGSGAEEEFIKETRIIGRLNHHNIVSIFDVGDHEGRPFIAMELLKGEFLSRLMGDGKRFSWSVVSHVAKQIASALEYAHNQGVVHGDIRPSNVLWNKDDNKVVLTDFGNATNNIYDAATLNVDQVSKSTPYLSPERINGHAIDKRSDLFSLGSLLYQMLTGYKPFDSDDFKELTTQITKRAHKAISVSETQVPEQFIKIIDRLLYKNPEDRYQSATEFLQELKLLPADANLPDPYSGKNNFKIAAVVLVLVCAGILFWTVKDWPNDKIATGSRQPSSAVEPNPELIARVVPKPEDAPKVVQLSTLQAGINKKLAKFECASLRAHMNAKSEVHIKGHVSLEEDMMSLMDLMDGYPGLSNVIYEVEAIKWPFCEAIAILSGDTRSNISNSSGLKLVNGDIERQVTNSEEFNFNVIAPNYDAYIYVDYYHINGTVTHLYPDSIRRIEKTAATSEFKVSHNSTNESGSLLGESLVVVLASYNPLGIKKRPKVEPAQQYLAELHREVVVNKLELSSSFMLLENIESLDN